MTADCVGGVWTYALQLAEGLAAWDVEIILVTMGQRPSRDQVRAATRLDNVRLIATDLKLEWQQDADDDLERAEDLLLDIEANCNPDLVHINGFANARAGFMAPVVVAAHSCVSSWWQACHGAAVPLEWHAYEARLREGVARADCLVAPTRSFLNTFVAFHGRPQRAEVIHNGRDMRFAGARSKQPFAFSAGRLWDEAKNLAGVLRAAERIDARVVVAGEGARPDRLAPNVVMPGKLSAGAMAAALEEAAVFLAPVRYEPFGLAILEAAQAGCALVLGDIGTLRELWDGVATFVDPDDPAALAAAANDLLGDPRQARARGTAAREHARRYGVETMTGSYMRLYRDLLDECPPPAHLVGAAPRASGS